MYKLYLNCYTVRYMPLCLSRGTNEWDVVPSKSFLRNIAPLFLRFVLRNKKEEALHVKGRRNNSMFETYTLYPELEMKLVVIRDFGWRYRSTETRGVTIFALSRGRRKARGCVNKVSRALYRQDGYTFISK